MRYYICLEWTRLEEFIVGAENMEQARRTAEDILFEQYGNEFDLCDILFEIDGDLLEDSPLYIY